MDIANLSEDDLLRCVSLQDPLPLLDEEARLPLTYCDDASENLVDLPPLVLRPPGPTVGDARLRDQLHDVDMVTHYDHATATDHLTSADDEVVREAVDHICALHTDSDGLGALPLHACEVLVSDHRAAMLLSPDGTTLLEATAARVGAHLASGVCVSLVASSQRYVFGTTMVEDEFARVYPDDRTMARAVVNVPHCGYSGADLDVIDRAVLGLLLVTDGHIVIKSLADVISTVYNAVLVSNPDAMARLQSADSVAQKVIASLSRHSEPRIAATFSVLRSVLASAAAGEYVKTNKTLFLAHTLTSAHELLEYDAGEQGLRQFFRTSLVIASLRDFGVTSVSTDDLSEADRLSGTHTSTIIRLLNEQLQEEPDCYRLKSPHSWHAAVDLSHMEVLEQPVTVKIEKPVIVKNEQCTLLSAVRKDTNVFTISKDGEENTSFSGSVDGMEGVKYTFSFRGGVLHARKSTTVASHYTRRFVHPLSRFGTVTAKWFSCNAEKLADCRVEPSEALDECLKGNCGSEASRWVLSKIYSKAIRVSKMSKVTYIPDSWKVSDEGAPIVSALLDRALVRNFACIVPYEPNKDPIEEPKALYMVLSESAPIMKVRIRSNTIYLSEDNLVDIGDMKKGVLDSDYTIG